MSKWHELTKKIHSMGMYTTIISGKSYELLDETIRTWLEEKVKELSRDTCLSQGVQKQREKSAKEILGLESPEGEPEKPLTAWGEGVSWGKEPTPEVCPNCSQSNTGTIIHLDDKRNCAVCGKKYPPTPEVKREWCEHICMSPIHTDKRQHHMKGRGFYVDSDWNYCPICLAPRPISKSLAQELFEAWAKATDNVGGWEELDGMTKSGYEAEAKAAEKWFKK